MEADLPVLDIRVLVDVEEHGAATQVANRPAQRRKERMLSRFEAEFEVGNIA